MLSLLLPASLAAQSYVWKNVKTGAGGFVTGLVYNTTEKGLLYARTDVGGAYRWDTLYRSWIALTDGFSNENHSGILSMATDPVQTSRVYMAAGLYTQSWAGQAALFASEDKGANWVKYDLPFKLGGNEEGRQTGERLQVDPNSTNILYLGTSKDGLWKSTDYGAAWEKLKRFPVQASTGGGISFVLPDGRSGKSGKATPVIYAGHLQAGAGVYKSSDAGKTWSLLPGQPADLMPQRAALTAGGKLYITFTNKPGPNDITRGAVYRFDVTSGEWTKLPLPEGMGGYAGISATPTGDTLLVSTLDRWAPKDEVYRSTDGGNSWQGLLTGAVYDCSSVPYAASLTPHWIGDVAMNPFNSNEAWFVTGYGVFHSNELANAAARQPVRWVFDNHGLEELVVSDLVCPPAGAALLSTVWDLDGFRHDNPDQSPASGAFTPRQGNNFSLAFAQQQPAYLVRGFSNTKGNYGAVSVNGGTQWRCFAAFPPGTTGSGTIAVTADTGVIVWSPAGAAMHRSVDGGNNWQPCAGVPAKLTPVVDRVNPLQVYAWDVQNGIFYISKNGAAAFERTAGHLPVLPDYKRNQASVKTVMGKEGHIWCTAGEEGLFSSTDGGHTFTKNETIQEATRIAFGKAAPGAAYPAIYLVGKAFGQYGFYRSIDGGLTWLRINSDRNQYLGIRAIAADANVFGRVYLGTSGRGIVYGEEYLGN